MNTAVTTLYVLGLLGDMGFCRYGYGGITRRVTETCMHACERERQWWRKGGGDETKKKLF